MTPATMHDVLVAAGPQAAHVVDLWRIALLICSLVFAAVLMVLAWALWRAPWGAGGAPAAEPSTAARRRHGRRVGIATGVATVLLLVLIGASVATDRAIGDLPLQGALHVEVTAHQWWWELRYDDADVSRVFTTANEMHVPVGRPVVLTLRSADVIHSLWFPSLGGKKDLIPGRTSTHLLQVDQPSRHRGPCAEFCGLQHAGMTLTLVSEPPSAYEAWAARQRASAATAPGAQVARGRELVVHGPCAMCHALTGTDASARTGPDLTHVASRATLAAGVLAHTPQTMANWITDPQVHKPGSHMPAFPLPDDDLQAVVAYLETLQ